MKIYTKIRRQVDKTIHSRIENSGELKGNKCNPWMGTGEGARKALGTTLLISVEKVYKRWGTKTIGQ